VRDEIDGADSTLVPKRCGKGFSRLMLPLVAVVACFVTAWLLTKPADRNAVKWVFRAMHVDFQAVEHYTEYARHFFSREERAVAKRPMQDVLVASVNLSPAQTLTKENMRWQPWPENGLTSVYITRSARPDALEKLVGSVVRDRMSFGEPIREAALSPETELPEEVSGAAHEKGTKPPIVIRGGERSRPLH
jgi:Flp pilus assembly protein CpaB